MKRFKHGSGLLMALCLLATGLCLVSFDQVRASTIELHSPSLLAQQFVPADEVGVPVVNADDTTINNILRIVFTIVGAVCLLFVLIGGLRYTMSGGNQANTKAAKDTIIYALAGAVITFAAFAIVQVVLGVLYG